MKIFCILITRNTMNLCMQIDRCFDISFIYYKSLNNVTLEVVVA